MHYPELYEYLKYLVHMKICTNENYLLYGTSAHAQTLPSRLDYNTTLLNDGILSKLAGILSPMIVYLL